jgi:hypothetical protein
MSLSLLLICLFLFRFGEASRKMVPARKYKWQEVLYRTPYCPCIGIVKFPLPIRLCIFLMHAMVMSEGRKVCNYYMWVCKVGLFTTDGCQKGVMNNTLLLVIASHSIDNSPIQFLKDCSIGIFCLSIIAVRQGMMRLVK